MSDEMGARVAQGVPSPREARGRRPAGRQLAFVVVAVEQLSPSLVRVHLGGDAFEAFIEGADPDRLAATDKYVKLLFASPHLDLEPPYDMEALRERLRPEEMPVRRTYTVRSVDLRRRRLAIDFVVHGDEGIAGPWAARAAVGDRLVLSGPGGQYRPADGGHWHLLVGDESAIPAIAAAVETLGAHACGLVLIEVESEEEELPLPVPGGVELRWLHRRLGDAPPRPHGEALVAAVSALDPPSGGIDVFAHGEREAMKRLRGVFLLEWGLDRRAISLSAYWALGRSEDRFQAEKREPIGQIFEASE